MQMCMVMRRNIGSRIARMAKPEDVHAGLISHDAV